MKTKFEVFPSISQQKLIHVLSKIPGKKDVIIDPKVIKPLEIVIGISTLRSIGTEKIYKLQSSDVPTSSNQRVFLVSSDLVSVKHVCDHINSEVCKDNSSVKFFLVIIPKKLHSILQLLEEEGVYEYVTTYSFSWELLPLDNSSILSLELPDYFNWLFVEGNQALLMATAQSIWSAFLILGKPCTSIVIGSHSQIVHRIISACFKQLGDPNKDSSYNIDYFIIMDRDADYVSTLLTPATYTALLDEVFGIRSGFVEVNDSLSTTLNNPHEIYSQIKNRHFSDVTAFLKSKAKSIQAEYDRSQKMKLEEIKNYVKKDLQNVTATKKSLSFHISACETIVQKLGDRFEKFQSIEEAMLTGISSRREVITFIEDCMASNVGDEFSTMRLICLLSLTQNGLAVEEASSLKSQFLHSFGFHYITMFHNLEKIGLFVVNSAISFSISDIASASNLASRVAQVMPGRKSSLITTIQKLKLVPASDASTEPTRNPSNLSYVFGGSFIPLVCQLVRNIIRKEVTADEISKSLQNCTVKVNKTPNATPKTFFVFIVGGITYAEACAFQLLEKLTGCQIVTASTNIINGNIVGITRLRYLFIGHR